MSDNYVSDDFFKIGVLTGLVGGVALFGYSLFLKKKSYLVEWRATLNPDYMEAEEENCLQRVMGTTMFMERPIWAKSHEDVLNRVFEIVKEHEKFQNVPADKIIVEIPHIHVL